MAKLVVDRIKCISSTDRTGDDLYFLVMHFDPNCNVHRVGPNSAWADMEDGDVRHTDVVLVDNVSGEYIVAVLDEDDSYDFDSELRSELSGAMRFIYKITSPIEKDRGRLLGQMMTHFASQIGRKRTNDDLLSVQAVSGATVMSVIGQGAHYQITLKAA
jgi:hypothetical protein